jgi:hypothetical protein
MGNQMSLEENENENEIKVIDETNESTQSDQSGKSDEIDESVNVNKKIKKNMQDTKSGLVKKRRSTSKSGANSNTFKKTRNNRRR